MRTLVSTGWELSHTGLRLGFRGSRIWKCVKRCRRVSVKALNSNWPGMEIVRTYWVLLYDHYKKVSKAFSFVTSTRATQLYTFHGTRTYSMEQHHASLPTSSGTWPKHSNTGETDLHGVDSHKTHKQGTHTLLSHTCLQWLAIIHLQCMSHHKLP